LCELNSFVLGVLRKGKRQQETHPSLSPFARSLFSIIWRCTFIFSCFAPELALLLSAELKGLEAIVDMYVMCLLGSFCGLKSSLMLGGCAVLCVERYDMRGD
ncbi:hypothetical protein KCU62_g73, partial [Aureobasidium sp. EXF-3399]